MTAIAAAQQHAWLELSNEERAARLSRLAAHALPLYGLDPHRCELRALRFGENAVFRVRHAARGLSTVLRIHRPGYNSDLAIRSELAWIEALRGAGVATAAAIPGRDGDLLQVASAEGVPEPRRCLMFEWIDGQPAARGELEPAFQLLGERIGRIHDHASSWQPPAWFERHSWDVAGLVGEAPLWGSHTELAGLPATVARAAAAAHEVVAAALAAFGKEPDRYGLIHADPNPTNILVKDGRAFVLDFDDCGFGWRLYDIATALYEHLADEELFARVRAAFLRGYTQAKELPEGHLAMLPVMLAARILVILGWCATRAETPRAQTHREARIVLAGRYLPRFLEEWPACI